MVTCFESAKEKSKQTMTYNLQNSIMRQIWTQALQNRESWLYLNSSFKFLLSLSFFSSCLNVFKISIKIFWNLNRFMYLMLEIMETARIQIILVSVWCVKMWSTLWHHNPYQLLCLLDIVWEEELQWKWP